MVMARIEIRTADEFNAFLTAAQPGECAVYYRGYLARDMTTAPVRALALAARLAQVNGQATLTQRRLAEDLYEYRVTRSRERG